MSQPIIFYGGSRHLTPSQGFATDTMTVLAAGEVDHLPPYRTERYVRTTVRVDVGDRRGPAWVYLIEGDPTGEPELAQLGFEWAQDPRVAEHYRFCADGTGRPWGRMPDPSEADL